MSQGLACKSGEWTAFVYSSELSDLLWHSYTPTRRGEEGAAEAPVERDRPYEFISARCNPGSSGVGVRGVIVPFRDVKDQWDQCCHVEVYSYKLDTTLFQQIVARPSYEFRYAVTLDGTPCTITPNHGTFGLCATTTAKATANTIAHIGTSELQHSSNHDRCRI